jgi:pyrroline-5-carboxylate reductase
MAKIAIIGCGNLGKSIANGLSHSTKIANSDIVLTKRQIADLAYFAELGMHVTSDNSEAVKSADIILLALKPYNLPTILKEIGSQLKPNQKLVSLASGVSLAAIEELVVPTEVKCFRAMPNTATAVNQGLTVVSSNHKNELAEKEVVTLFNEVGETLVLDEQLLDAVTILGACGIAYVMRFMRAMVQGGIQIGFDAQTAATIVQHTVRGSAQLLVQNDTHPEQEIDKVTTPKGCTIVGLNEMEHAGFSSALIKGIVKSFDSLN